MAKSKKGRPFEKERNSIGRNLQALIQASGLEYKQVAALATERARAEGKTFIIDYNFIYRLINGQTNFPIDKLVALSLALDVSLESFFTPDPVKVRDSRK